MVLISGPNRKPPYKPCCFAFVIDGCFLDALLSASLFLAMATAVSGVVVLAAEAALEADVSAAGTLAAGASAMGVLAVGVLAVDVLTVGVLGVSKESLRIAPVLTDAVPTMAEETGPAELAEDAVTSGVAGAAEWVAAEGVVTDRAAEWAATEGVATDGVAGPAERAAEGLVAGCAVAVAAPAALPAFAPVAAAGEVVFA